MKKKIFIFLLIIICLVIILSVTFKYLKNNTKSKFSITSIDNINEAYDVQQVVFKYYEYCKKFFDTNQILVYNLIDKDYINHYDLNKYNFKQNIDLIESDSLRIKSVYKIATRGDLNLYIVKADELYKSESESKELNLMIKINSKENIFSIYPNDYVIEFNYNNLNIKSKGSILINDIEKNDNNSFDASDKIINDSINDVFNNYKQLCMFYYSDSYKVIDEECKKQKFNSFEVYDKYLSDNYRDIVMMSLSSYEETKKDDYIEYRCIDNKGKEYIFKVYSYITYTVTIL